MAHGLPLFSPCDCSQQWGQLSEGASGQVAGRGGVLSARSPVSFWQAPQLSWRVSDHLLSATKLCCCLPSTLPRARLKLYHRPVQGPLCPTQPGCDPAPDWYGDSLVFALGCQRLRDADGIFRCSFKHESLGVTSWANTISLNSSQPWWMRQRTLSPW